MAAKLQALAANPQSGLTSAISDPAMFPVSHTH